MEEEKLPSLKETKITDSDSDKSQESAPVTKPDMKQMRAEDALKKDKLEPETIRDEASHEVVKPQDNQGKDSFLGRFGSRIRELWKEKSKHIREMV